MCLESKQRCCGHGVVLRVDRLLSVGLQQLQRRSTIAAAVLVMKEEQRGGRGDDGG